jgi:SpoVK/Ycf46/Vps4 family AAA+-type ATPase
MNIQEYVDKVAEDLRDGAKSVVKRKASSLLKALKTPEMTAELVENLQSALSEKAITASPELTGEMDKNAWVEFSFAHNTSLDKPWFVDEAAYFASKNMQTFAVQEDFFHALFDFGSRYEYERFQSALDSVQPVALFLMPQDEDFFSDVVERVLSFELVKKRLYKNDDSGTVFFKKNQFKNAISEEQTDAEKWEDWTGAEIFHFNRAEMESVILGQSATEMLESNRFEDQFDRLAVYANRYTTAQFFVVFHCPSLQKIQKSRRGEVLNALIAKISQRMPFVFTLQCKFGKESDISAEAKSNIFQHFKLLNEQPTQEVDMNLTLNDCFGELQKNFLHINSRMFYTMRAELFAKLRWEQEPDETVFAKYFAMKTLIDKLGYTLQDIECYEHNDYDSSNADIIVKETDIHILVETLKGKSHDKNVYMDFYKSFISRLEYLPDQLRQLWIVLPCFEVGRNYYQVKKLCELLNTAVKTKLTYLSNFSIFVADYSAQNLIPISFEQLPSLDNIAPAIIEAKSKIALTKQKSASDITFDDVIGLEEEKNELRDLIALQQQDFNFGLGGIIFYGLPGCGKTYLANAFANELQRHFFCFSPAEIVSKWIGESAQNIRSIFNEARSKAPALLFIDEIDSIGFDRNEENAHSDQRATINQILIEMNNVNEKDILVIAATNRITSLDPALVRAGRFDYKIPIFPPLLRERAMLFKYYIQQLAKEINPHYPDCVQLSNFDFGWIAEETAGLAPSDIKSVINKLRIDIIRRRILKPANSDVFKKVKLLQDTAQLTLNYDLIQAFISECNRNGYSSPKLDALKDEWNIR